MTIIMYYLEEPTMQRGLSRSAVSSYMASGFEFPADNSGEGVWNTFETRMIIDEYYDMDVVLDEIINTRGLDINRHVHYMNRTTAVITARYVYELALEDIPRYAGPQVLINKEQCMVLYCNRQTPNTVHHHLLVCLFVTQILENFSSSHQQLSMTSNSTC